MSHSGKAIGPDFGDGLANGLNSCPQSSPHNDEGSSLGVISKTITQIVVKLYTLAQRTPMRTLCVLGAAMCELSMLSSLLVSYAIAAL